MRPLTNGLATMALTATLLAGCGGDGDDGAGGEATAASFCEDVEAVQARFSALATESTPDPALFNEISTAFDELAEDAPEEIAGDMDALAAALGSLADIFEDVDLTDPEAMAQLQEQAAELQEQAADVEEASTNVQAYLDEECDISLDEAVPGMGTEGVESTEGTEGTSSD